MERLYIVVEGQTEEAFVNEIIRPALYARQVNPIACLLGKPGHKGGRTNYARVSNDVLRLLKQDRGARCSTMLDWYGLGKNFPGMNFEQNLTNLQKVAQVERAMLLDISARATDDIRVDARFVPYLQLHEYEGLLFSDCGALARGIYEEHLAAQFQQIRNAYPTPEEINDGIKTAPSKQLIKICPRYDKRLYGPLAALAVGLETMRRECPHFNQWITTLEALSS